MKFAGVVTDPNSIKTAARTAEARYEAFICVTMKYTIRARRSRTNRDRFARGPLPRRAGTIGGYGKLLRVRVGTGERVPNVEGSGRILAWVVEKYGLHLMPELYEYLNPMPIGSLNVASREDPKRIALAQSFSQP
jgi:hypothetical protein